MKAMKAGVDTEMTARVKIAIRSKLALRTGEARADDRDVDEPRLALVNSMLNVRLQ